MTELREMPAYSAVTTDNALNTGEQPPSYFNVVAQLQTAKADAKNPIEFTQRAVGILCGSFIFTIILGISMILPVAMLIIGVLHKNECMINTKIPIWLIVSGVVGIVTAILRFISNIVAAIRFKRGGERKGSKVFDCFVNVLSLFFFVWFIIGNVWVYSIADKVQYDPILYPYEYCDKVLYLFAFWSITCSWIMLGLSCLCLCGTIACISAAACACCLCVSKSETA